MAERLYAEPFYHPLAGMNIDANGLTAKTNEAIDCVNVDITASSVTARGGTKLLGDPTITNFTVANSLFTPDQEGVYVRINDAPPLIGHHYEYNSGTNLYSIASTPGGWVCYNVTTSTLVNYHPDIPTQYPPSSGWISSPTDVPDTLTITLIENQISAPVLKYHRYIHATLGAMLFAFCASGIYKYDDTLGWVSVYSGSAFVVQKWSVTDVIDHKFGATIVAAASTYTLPTVSYSDATDRVLFVYDTLSSNEFIDFQLKTNIYDNEILTPNIVLSPPAINTWDLAVDRVLVPGTAYLVIDTIGVIATASTAIHIMEFGAAAAKEEVEVNFWIPVDEDEVGFGEDSYVILDVASMTATTPAVSVDFLKNTYDGLAATIVYQHEADIDYKPLHVSNYHNALVVSNTAEFFIEDTTDGSGSWKYTPWRVRWSEQGNIALFRQNHYQDLALDDISPILGMRALETAASSTIKGPLYFYKHNSIIRGSYNQNYNLDPNFPVPMFTFDIAYSEGVEATDTIVAVEGKHFYLGRNDVYAFNGYERVSLTHDAQTGGTRVQKYIFDHVNLDALYRAFGVYDEINRKYYLFLTYDRASSIYPEDCMVYDIDNNSWSRNTYNPISAGIDLDANPGGAINSLSGETDGLDGSIDDLTTNTSKQLYFSIGNFTYSVVTPPIDEIGINDVEFDSYFITRDFIGETLEDQDRVQRVYVEAKNDSIDISYSGQYDTDPDEFLQEDTLSFGVKFRKEIYNPDATTSAIRFKVSFNIQSLYRWMQVFSKRQELTND